MLTVFVQKGPGKGSLGMTPTCTYSSKPLAIEALEQRRAFPVPSPDLGLITIPPDSALPSIIEISWQILRYLNLDRMVRFDYSQN